MKEAPGSSETLVLTRATWRNKPEDTILRLAIVFMKEDSLRQALIQVFLAIVLQHHLSKILLQPCCGHNHLHVAKGTTQMQN
jgi:hypothetical protein